MQEYRNALQKGAQHRKMLLKITVYLQGIIEGQKNDP